MTDEERNKKFVLPSVSAADPLDISDSDIQNITSKLKSLSSTGEFKECDWCGQIDWCVNKRVFTDTSFHLIGDHHEHGQVHPLIMIDCNNCGNTKRFDLKKFGYATKGGLKENG